MRVTRWSKARTYATRPAAERTAKKREWFVRRKADADSEYFDRTTRAVDYDENGRKLNPETEQTTA